MNKNLVLLANNKHLNIRKNRKIFDLNEHMIVLLRKLTQPKRNPPEGH